jgi:hypothetical protein
VQDQLKVSEGWVRCGQCNEVFNALESLFDLERDTPPEWSPPSRMADDMPSRLGSPVDLELPVDARAAQAHEQDHDEPHAQPHDLEHDAGHARASDEPVFEESDHFDVPMMAHHHEAATSPAERIDERDRLEFPDARFDPESESPAGHSLVPVHDTTLEPLAEPDAASAAPEFVRHARRRELWNGRGMRIGLSLASLLLVGAFALQAAHHFRDTVAARWPETQDALSAWCGAVGCTVSAPKHIDDIAVESTSLTRAEGADAFRLAVTLRNHGALALALPSIDLTLTDAGGQLVARKMLAPKEWRVAGSTLAAGAELPMQLLLAADGGRVSGYTVEVFYP